MSVVAYTAYPWHHALTVLRLVEPLRLAGLTLVRGTDGGGIYPERVSQADVVVIQRDFPRWEEAYQQIMGRARAEGKPVVYELDDLLLELPRDHPDWPIHYYTPALFPILRAIIEADGVTCSTPLLCAYLRPFNPNTFLLPNYLPDRLWPVQEAQVKQAGGPVVIGYMGSTTHLPDLEGIAPALSRLLDRFGSQVRLRFWGAQPPQALQGRAEVEWIQLGIWDYNDFAGYFTSQESDIFIAPLAEGDFNRCKSAIKFLEYSSRAVPGVYSRIAPYESVVRHGENGFLASTPEDWESCLARLIEDPELRRQTGGAAAEAVRSGWLLSDHAHEWPAAYRQAASRKRASALNGSAAPAGSGMSEAEQARAAVLRMADQAQAWHRTLQGQLFEKDRTIERLQRELQGVYSGRDWALLQKILRLRHFLAPEGSRRSRLLRALFPPTGTRSGE
jgi:glycosyltransferase involved in cell wall biosynthesis